MFLFHLNLGEFFINFNYNSKELSLTIILSLVFSFLLEFYIILLENPSKHNFLNLFSIKHFIVFLILFLIVFILGAVTGIGLEHLFQHLNISISWN